MPPIPKTIILLTISNVFMTFAWYAQLKELSHKPWIVAALVSWGIALFEYAFSGSSESYWAHTDEHRAAKDSAGTHCSKCLRSDRYLLSSRALEARLSLGGTLFDWRCLLHVSGRAQCPVTRLTRRCSRTALRAAADRQGVRRTRTVVACVAPSPQFISSVPTARLGDLDSLASHGTLGAIGLLVGTLDRTLKRQGV